MVVRNVVSLPSSHFFIILLYVFSDTILIYSPRTKTVSITRGVSVFLAEFIALSRIFEISDDRSISLIFKSRSVSPLYNGFYQQIQIRNIKEKLLVLTKINNYLIRGVLIGLLFGMPVEAVGAMTIHRTLNYGFKAGFLTDLDSSVAGCL